MTSDQLFDLAVQFSAMARVAETKRLTFPPDSQQAQDLGHARATLTNASSQLLAPALNAALNNLSPHYDAMLSVVRHLNKEVADEAKITRLLQLISSALSIAIAVQMGNPALVLTAIGEARTLLAPGTPL